MRFRDFVECFVMSFLVADKRAVGFYDYVVFVAVFDYLALLAPWMELVEDVNQRNDIRKWVASTQRSAATATAAKTSRIRSNSVGEFSEHCRPLEKGIQCDAHVRECCFTPPFTTQKIENDVPRFDSHAAAKFSHSPASLQYVQHRNC